MRALVWNPGSGLCMGEVAAPDCPAGQVVLEVGCTGIAECEVLRLAGGGTPPTLSYVPGWECAGRVVEVGAGVDGPAPGTRVVVDPCRACGCCAACQTVRPEECPHRLEPGPDRPGALAARVVVPAVACHALPAGLTFQAASLAEPLAHSLTLVRWLEAADRRVLLAGLGTLGLLTLQELARTGAKEIIALDARPHMLGLAAELGASHTLRLQGGAWVRWLKELWPDGPERVVVTAPALADKPVDFATVAAPGARMVVTTGGRTAAAPAVDLPPGASLELAVQPHHEPADFSAAVARLGDDTLELDAWSTMRPLEAGPDSLMLLAARREPVARVTLTPLAVAPVPADAC